MTDSKTATERLRELLDERGESRIDDDYGTTWSYYTDPHTATESMDGTLIVTGLTPEQAIAATLGSEREKALKELVRDMYEQWAYSIDGYYRWLLADYRKRMAELGLEVGR